MDSTHILEYLCAVSFSRSCPIHFSNSLLDSTLAIKSINVALQLDSSQKALSTENSAVLALLTAILRLIECNDKQKLCYCIDQAHLLASLALKNVVMKRWSNKSLTEDEKIKICQFFFSDTYLLAIRTGSLTIRPCIQFSCTCAIIFSNECNNASSNDIFSLTFALRWLQSSQEDLCAILSHSNTAEMLADRCKGLAATLLVVKETLSKKQVSKSLANETNWTIPIQQLQHLLIYHLSAIQTFILDFVNSESGTFEGIIDKSYAVCLLSVCSILSAQVIALCPFIPESVEALLNPHGLPLQLRLLQDCLHNHSRNLKPDMHILSDGHRPSTHITQLLTFVVEDEVDDSFAAHMHASEPIACTAMLAINIRSLIRIPGQLLKLDSQKILPLLVPILQFCMDVLESYSIVEGNYSIDSALNKEVASSAVLLLSDTVKTLTVISNAAANTGEIISFFSSDRIEMLLKILLEKLLVLDREEFEEWVKDPHQFFADQIMLTEDVCVRAAAEGLFYGLLELCPDYVTTTMLSLLGNNTTQIDLITGAHKEVGSNAAVGFWSSVYLCAGLGAAVLCEKMDSLGGAHSWMDKLFRPVLNCLLERNNHSDLRSAPDGRQILGVRVVWMLSVWMSLVFQDIENGDEELINLLARLVQDICKFICYAAQSVSQNINDADVVVLLYCLQAMDAVVKVPQFRLEHAFSVSSTHHCSKFPLQHLLQALCHLCHSALTSDSRDLGEMALSHLCLDLLAELVDLLSMTAAGLRKVLVDEGEENQASLSRRNSIYERPLCADIMQQSVENILLLWQTSSNSNKMILPHIIKVASKIVIASALGGSSSTTYTEIFHFKLLQAMLPLLRSALLLSASKRLSANLVQQSMILWLGIIRLARWSIADCQGIYMQQEDCITLQQTREQLVVLLQDVIALQGQVVVPDEGDGIDDDRDDDDDDAWLMDDEEYSTAQQLTDLLLVLEAYCSSFADFLLADSTFASVIRSSLERFYCGDDGANSLSEWVMGRGVGGLLGEVSPSLVWFAVRPLESLLLAGPAAATAWIHSSGILRRLLLLFLAAPAHGSSAWEERCSFTCSVLQLLHSADCIQPATAVLGQANRQLEALCEADVAVVQYLTLISRMLLVNPSLIIDSLQLLWDQIVPSQPCQGCLPALSVASIVGELLRRFDTIDFCPGAVIRRRLWCRAILQLLGIEQPSKRTDLSMLIRQAAGALQQRLWPSFSLAISQLRELQNAMVSSGSVEQQPLTALENVLRCCEAVSSDHGGDDLSYEEVIISAVQELLSRDGSSSEGLLYAIHPNDARPKIECEELRVGFSAMEPLEWFYYRRHVESIL